MPTTPILTGQDIAEAHGAVRALLDEILAHTGTRGNEYVALRVLALRGPYASPVELHEFLAAQRQLALDPTEVAGLLAGLEDRGLVSGTAVDGPGPARLTEQGSALYEQLSGTISPATARLYAALDPADLATARRVLATVAERAALLRNEIHAG